MRNNQEKRDVILGVLYENRFKTSEEIYWMIVRALEVDENHAFDLRVYLTEKIRKYKKTSSGLEKTVEFIFQELFPIESTLSAPPDWNSSYFGRL